MCLFFDFLPEVFRTAFCRGLPLEREAEGLCRFPGVRVGRETPLRALFNARSAPIDPGLVRGLGWERPAAGRRDFLLYTEGRAGLLCPVRCPMALRPFLALECEFVPLEGRFIRLEGSPARLPGRLKTFLIGFESRSWALEDTGLG